MYIQIDAKTNVGDRLDIGVNTRYLKYLRILAIYRSGSLSPALTHDLRLHTEIRLLFLHVPVLAVVSDRPVSYWGPFLILELITCHYMLQCRHAFHES